jgi:pyruvate dehydrogenase E1 component beta subunit
MAIEALRAAAYLEKDGIEAEIVDLRTLNPIDVPSILQSVRRTGRVVAVDGAWKSFGVSAEILARVAEELHGTLKAAPRRVTFPDVPSPSTPGLAKYFYPRTIHIVNAVRETLGMSAQTEAQLGIQHETPLDVPDKAFTGPF